MSESCTVKETTLTVKTTEHYTPEELIDLYGVPLYRFCRRLAYTREDAEDLFQETFLHILERPQRLDEASEPQSVLFSMALSLWKSQKRKYARRRRIAPTEPLEETEPGLGDVEADYLAREEERRVRELVDALPDKYKIPIILYYGMDQSVSAIAATLRVPEGTVKSRLYKARKLIEKGWNL